MKFQIGDLVLLGGSPPATVIAIPENATHNLIIIGWKKNTSEYGWKLRAGSDIISQFGKLTIIHRMFEDFGSAYWVSPQEIRLLQECEKKIKTHTYPVVKLYTPVSLKRLQKKAREQVAQQFLISKG